MTVPSDRPTQGRGAEATATDRAAWLYRAYAGFFLVALALTIVMLLTDNNLRTNFGTVSGYFFHWWVILVIGIADAVGAVLLLVLGSRLAVKGGVIGSLLIVVIFLGVIATYGQVGFSSASAFAQYLFGVTYYGGDIRYLYDALLGVYLATLVFGAVVLWRTRPATAAPPSAGAIVSP